MVRGSSSRCIRNKTCQDALPLPRLTFKQLTNIQQHEQVVSAWNVSGVIRFKVRDSDAVFKVSSIFDTVEE
jgi:hypothetical protein